MIEAQRVDYITVPTNDVARAEAFYGDVLGLEKNPNSLHLPHGAIALRVPDVEAAKRKLEAAGVECGDVWDSGSCNGATFTDPDGNGLTIHHRYAPYPDGTTP